MGKIIQFPSLPVLPGWDPVMALGTPAHSVRVFIAPMPRAAQTFYHTTALRQPGFYIGVWSDEVYTGAGHDVADRTKTSKWRGAPPPDDCLVGVVSADEPWQEEMAFAIERIAYAALYDAGLPIFQSVPRGKSFGATDYARAQVHYADAVQLLRPVLPALACPWQGPWNRLREGDRESMVERRVCTKQIVTDHGTTTIRCEGHKRWIVEAGSLIRQPTTRSSGEINVVLREELEFSGYLVCLGNDTYRLTRDLLFSSRSKCSRFVHSGRGEIHTWQLVSDADALKLSNATLHPVPRRRR